MLNISLKYEIPCVYFCLFGEACVICDEKKNLKILVYYKLLQICQRSGKVWEWYGLIDFISNIPWKAKLWSQVNIVSKALQTGSTDNSRERQLDN